MKKKMFVFTIASNGTDFGYGMPSLRGWAAEQNGRRWICTRIYCKYELYRDG